jgi:Leucine-rich repeat (LRR) protein
MKKVTILFIVLLTSSFVFAQNTYVPDDKFEQALIDLGYDTTLDDYVLTANISVVTVLLVTNKGISDLTGIEAFTALTRLDCNNNQLTSVDLSKNTALTELYIGENQLTSLDVSKNTALTSLMCGENQLTSLDVSKNTLLWRLGCYKNQLTSLDVSKNTALTNLICWQNQLTSLDVRKNTALTELTCIGNQLTSLDVSKNTALTSLTCNDNQLTSLDVSKNTALEGLSCTDNKLTALDLSANTALTKLHCDRNQLTSLDVSKHTELVSLTVNSNLLTSLDVSENIGLTQLYCGSNQLTSLDVSKNTALESLSCSHNQLTSLDVSKHTELSFLYCQSNQLTSLNMRNGVTDQLSDFFATGNSGLTCIETLDPAYATTNLAYIDAGVTFSVICGGTDLTTWHVDTTGSDGSGSGTLASPLATIQTGINAATDSDTVSVSAGTYNNTINFMGKNIVVKGENKETTIISGAGYNTDVVKFNSGEDTTACLTGFTISNGEGSGIWIGDGVVNNTMYPTTPKLENLIVTNNLSTGIKAMGSSVIIRNVIIEGNVDLLGGAGGLYLIVDKPTIIENVLIHNNTANAGGGIMVNSHQATVTLKNVTITENKSTHGDAGSLQCNSCDINLINSIVWGNSGNEILINKYNDPGKISVSFSDIEGGASNIITNGNGTVELGSGNIDADPLFCDTLSYKYYDTSPVVGTGENGVNMGAGGIGCDVPPAFTWVTPSEFDNINITKENLNTEYIVKWTTSKDIYNDSLRYHIVGNGGNLIVSTSDTSNSRTYQELLEEWPAQFQMLSRMTYVYGVWVTDGKDSTKITGEPRKLYVNRYEYLSTVSEGIPTVFALHENYPNPFNPTTTLRFDLPEVSDITLSIYNMLGQRVRTFNMNDTPAGYHSVTWNATNDYGDPVGAGVYLYQLRANQFVKTRKMVLLK